MAGMLKITQVRSIIEQLEAAKRTIKALGLGRPNYSVIKKDTPRSAGCSGGSPTS